MSHDSMLELTPPSMAPAPADSTTHKQSRRAPPRVCKSTREPPSAAPSSPSSVDALASGPPARSINLVAILQAHRERMDQTKHLLHHPLLYRRPGSALEADNFSIDSKDSCKPEKCESPFKEGPRPPAAAISRNGQGTSPDPRVAMFQLSDRFMSSL